MDHIQLTKKLLEQDVAHRLPKHQEVKRIQKTVESIVHQILDKVAKRDERFKSKLLRVGSYYDGLKVGLPDEFDFLVELENFTEHENFEIRPSGIRGTKDLWRTSVGSPVLRKIQILSNSDIFSKCDIDDEYYNRWITQVGRQRCQEYVLDPVNVKNTFFSLVNDVVKEIKESPLSLYLEISESPTFVYGPAVTLSLNWNGRAFKNLTISVDLTVGIKFMSWDNYLDVLDHVDDESCLKETLKRVLTCHGCHLTPFVGEDNRNRCKWRISTSYVENQIMKTFPEDSNIKIVLRAIKYDRNSTGLLKTMFPLVQIEKGESAARDLQTLIYGPYHKDLLPSYLIKTIGLHSLTELSFKDMKKIPLSNLYVFVLCHLYKFIEKRYLPNFFIGKHILTLPETEDVVPGLYELFKVLNIKSIAERPKCIYTWERNKGEISLEERMQLDPFFLRRILQQTKYELQCWYDMICKMYGGGSPDSNV